MNSVKVIWMQSFTLYVAILVCGCAGGGVSYDPGSLPDFAIDSGAVSHPYYTYEPQNVWVRTLGQPDQLVTVLPAY